MNWNVRLFQKINSLVGRSTWLDAFGRAGAEWAVIAMIGWYVASAFILPSRQSAYRAIAFLALTWFVGWVLDIIIGMVVKEPRPHVTYFQSKLLFTPLMSWKSFPSDHAMSAFTIFFLALLFSLPHAWALLPLALWVSWGRVYAGVHYPFDIVGGATVAGLVSVLAYYVQVLFF